MNSKTADYLWNNKEYYSKGKRGFIFVSVFNGKKFAIKTKNPESEKDPVELEAHYNKKLNKIGIGPEFYYFNKKRNFMIRQFVDGENILEWMKGKNKNEVREVVLDLLKQCRKMDLIGVNKMELTHPHKDIIVDLKGKPWIIDFERCKMTEKPKNVTQFLQFLISSKLISNDIENIKKISRNYKEGKLDNLKDLLRFN